MQLKPIKTEKVYDTALKQIEHLWGAAPGTPDSERLEVLTTLVEANEATAFPIDMPDPIDASRIRRDQRG